MAATAKSKDYFQEAQLYQYLEAYSRRENLKFENIPETVESGVDKELVLRSFLERELGYVDTASVEIQRVHRLGRKKDGKSQPILAIFLRFKDCQSMLALGPRLRETNYRMYQDLPFEIVERRRAQWILLRRPDRETTSRLHSVRHSPTSSSSEGNFGLLAKNLNCKHNLSIVVWFPN